MTRNPCEDNKEGQSVTVLNSMVSQGKVFFKNMRNNPRVNSRFYLKLYQEIMGILSNSISELNKKEETLK